MLNKRRVNQKFSFIVFFYSLKTGLSFGECIKIFYNSNIFNLLEDENSNIQGFSNYFLSSIIDR